MQKLPLVSRLEVIKNSKRILKNPLPFHRENFEKFGDLFRVSVAFEGEIVFTRNPKIVKHILQKQHKKYQKSTLQTVDLAKYIGHGILTSNGEHWRTHRRMVQPAFHKKKLHNLMGTIRSAIKVELEDIKPGVILNAYPLMSNLAFQVVAKSLFSSEDIREKMQELQHITEVNQRMLIKEMRQPYLKWWFNLNGTIKKHLKLAEDGQELLNDLIESRRKSKIEKDDLLDMLLQARYEDGTAMSQKQLIDEVLILFTAGHETTANALSFLFFLLAKHPEMQEKAYKEVKLVDLDSEDVLPEILKLKYVQHCIEETMRLYPPAYIIDRVSLENDEIDDLKIPKDTMVLMSIYELHRYEQFWELPNDFIPERFETLDKKKYQDYYYPFGAGPRMCVGNNFAMYEMILAVTEILKKYRITTNLKTLDINPLISLKPLNVELKFTARI
ncbi:cytochrome P450 [Cellulophaga baltica]|uniref:cytochrome P450 n=1 Tax=Cellulophaga TaxID=104264 RepID=UPI001C077329|nr:MULTISPECIES: cytochrome P450 [Cellulophaga]MBU2997195.1 cytochrome P450 [Cellulophaga baltica]MDO6768593.1 cytochrome P450 [Cellulophaga sp. 1_MG-2023]